MRTADKPPEREIGESRLRALSPLGKPWAPRQHAGQEPDPRDHDKRPPALQPPPREAAPRPDMDMERPFTGAVPRFDGYAEKPPPVAESRFQERSAPWAADARADDMGPAGRIRAEPLPFRSLRARSGDVAARLGPLLDPGRPGLRVLLVLGVLAALIGGLYAWRSRPEVEPLAPPTPQAGLTYQGGVIAPGGPVSQGSVTSQSGPMAQAGPSTSQGSATQGSQGGLSASRPGPMVVPPTSFSSTTSLPGGQVIVHVTGKVRKPGVITLPIGSRVADAVNAAGGVRAGATAGGLNLARKLSDGEQIVVGASSGPGLGTVPAPDPASGTSDVLDLNAATPIQLETLPGVGEVLAGRIAEFRQTHAGFRSVDQLRQVTGIGEKKFAELRDKVRV